MNSISNSLNILIPNLLSILLVSLETKLRKVGKITSLPKHLSTILAFQIIASAIMLTYFLFWPQNELHWFLCTTTEFLFWLVISFSYSVISDHTYLSHSPLFSISAAFLFKIMSSFYSLVSLDNTIVMILFKAQCGITLFMMLLFVLKFRWLDGYTVLNGSPEENFGASLFSRCFLSYMYPLLNKGRLVPLQKEDVQEVTYSNKAKVQDQQFSKILKQRLKNGGKNALLKAIFKRFKAKIILAIVLQIAVVIFDLLCPLYIILIVNFLYDDEMPQWKGFALVFYLVLVKILQSVMIGRKKITIITFGVNLRTALTTNIFKKCLTTNSVKHSMSKVTNLVQVDIARMVEAIPFVTQALAQPIQLGATFLMFYYLIGWVPATACCICVVAFLLINLAIIKSSKKRQRLLMNQRDTRMKYCTEFLSSIKILKLYNWENIFSQQISDQREEEVKRQVSYLKILGASATLAWGMRNYVSISMLVSMALLGYEFKPGPTFAGLVLVNSLISAVTVVPDIINNFSQSSISLTRITEFLTSGDYTNYIQPVDKKLSDTHDILVDNLNVSWAGSSTPCVKDIDLHIHRGEFIAIVGAVGSGKSALLRSLVGNMSISGSVQMNPNVAFVEQEPWIQNMTLRDNILFGSRYNKARYHKIIKLCELTHDIEVLPGGDKTEIGERGINLSGGQKARITLARAMYKNPDVILMDDPLSAVDSHVGQRIMQNVLLSYCKRKTRILISHGQQYLPQVDRVIVMKEGKIIEDGPYRTLATSDTYFASEYLVSAGAPIDITEEFDTSESPNPKKKPGNQIIGTEDRETGKVNFQVYKQYIKYAGGWKIIVIGMITMAFWTVCSWKLNILIVDWTKATQDHQVDNKLYFIIAYLVLSLGTNVAAVLRLVFFWQAGLRAARSIFSEVLSRLKHAPINTYYDTTPLGRILNRLSKDQTTIDHRLFTSFARFVANAFRLIFVVGICVYSVPYAAILIPLIGFLGYRVQQIYIKSSRELTRLEAISKSPIIQNIGETISGSHIIRAYGMQKQFVERNEKRLDNNAGLFIAARSANAWVNMHLEFASVIFMAGCMAFIVAVRGLVEPSYAAMCLGNVMSLPVVMFQLALTVSDVENSMVSFERQWALTKIESEAPMKRHKDELIQYQNWPQEGRIRFIDYQMKYRNETPIILKGINFEILGREKVGIVGRTGSGKSSLSLGLFRIIESFSGRIEIDGMDISELGLNLLRQKLCIIPQDPTLFTGTIRYNIDPMGTAKDTELIECLKDVGYYSPDLLNTKVRANGDNLSVGQKQQICLARALVRKSRIMILDEATASIDYKTDKTIQTVIRDKFSDFTVLTVAHRINTIMDYDKVLVLEAGNVAEFGHPWELLDRKGLFYKLANSA